MNKPALSAETVTAITPENPVNAALLRILADLDLIQRVRRACGDLAEKVEVCNQARAGSVRSAGSNGGAADQKS